MAEGQRIETVDSADELLPFDQVHEGVFVRSITFPQGAVEVASLAFEEVDVNGDTYKHPVWTSEPEIIYPDYPIRVVRGLEPPRAR